MKAKNLVKDEPTKQNRLFVILPILANLIFFRAERIENSTGQLVRIFAIGYDSEYIGGQLQLGDHHDKMELVNIDKFDPKEYFEGGWLAGVQEYINKFNFK